MLQGVISAESDPVELEDRWLVGWRGLRVEQLRVDYRLVLVLGDDSELAVEQSATVSDHPGKAADVRRARIVPEAGDVAAALPLLRKTVLSSVAFKSGALRVVFDSGHQLEVQPSDEFEAWTGVGPGAMRWVCLPGGGLSVWS
jgi:hypothetical protein